VATGPQAARAALGDGGILTGGIGRSGTFLKSGPSPRWSGLAQLASQAEHGGHVEQADGPLCVHDALQDRGCGGGDGRGNSLDARTGIIDQPEDGFDQNTGTHLAIGEHQDAAAPGEHSALDSEQGTHVDDGQHPAPPVGHTGQPERTTRNAGQRRHLHHVIDRVQGNGIAAVAQPNADVRLLDANQLKRLNGPGVIESGQLYRSALHLLVIGPLPILLKPRGAVDPPGSPPC
jgi:hypothetical protein